MKNWQEIIHQQTFRYMDQTNTDFIEDVPISAMTSFAIDDALTTSISAGDSPPTVRLWAHPDTIVLGIPDARLPFIEQGITMLHDQGFDVVVRNSGGLAVALDSGVLNLSLMLPDVKHISIYECYEAMVRLIQFMLRDKTQRIEAYEIVGSYCPGDYDLSIDDRKFAGISQRRIKNGAAVQIYLDVNGDSQHRAALIRDFYAKSIQGEPTKFAYPDVKPETMASLTELLGEEITVEEMKKRVYTALEVLSEQIIVTNFSKEEMAIFQKRLRLMEKRNEFIDTGQSSS